MKRELSLGILLVSLATVVSGAPASLQRFLFCGSDYVRAEDWAAINRYQLRWITPRQEFKLSNGDSVFYFTVDSRKSILNGVTVWLNHPIGLRNGAACIPWKDVTATLQPLLRPAKNATGKKILVVCLDPGHGGKDPGNMEGKQVEKQYTLAVAKELGSLLTKAGLKVCYTRSRDTTLEPVSRAQIANQRNADLFVSLHFNSADFRGGAAVKGAEVYCMTPAYESSTNARGEGTESGAYAGNRFDSKNIVLACEMQKALTRNLGMEDRGVKRARFAVLRSATMPAVLIEGGFMTNASEAKKIYDSAWRRQLARAMLDGIMSYKRLVET